jgi:hypothetical protein
MRTWRAISKPKRKRARAMATAKIEVVRSCIVNGQHHEAGEVIEVPVGELAQYHGLAHLKIVDEPEPVEDGTGADDNNGNV